MQSVAFLRGINLGKRRVANAELVGILSDLGLDGVSAYQAAGNLLFDPVDGDVEDRISRGLEEALGYAVAVFVRTAAELHDLARRTLFDEALVGGKAKPQVTLLRAAPDADAIDAVAALSTEVDRVFVDGREWYWLPTEGISGTQLDLKAVERLVGVGTTRTLGTLQRIAKKLG